MISVPRVMHLMKRDRLNTRVGKNPGIVMAAVMEYICAEIIEVAGEQAKSKNRTRIQQRDI